MYSEGNETPAVTELRIRKEEKLLVVSFANGESFELPAELLRVESPSAEVQGHSPAEKKIIPGRRHVGIIGAEPIGNYAVKLTFDDLHDSGIYTWSYLYELGENMNEVWDNYVTNLEAAGLSRDP
ncbi:gamma-butyrobetaine hydroxylase-like domain-containing protein [Terasakiella sp.]|uniref:gamma-butyrobetaine hydroxylase-like domain-containing protein n=1 Tax=Terasakiella sp. TaxID=2034861 RepID=UPI003AA7D4B5